MATITYNIINGTWSETSSGPQVTTVVKEYAAGKQMTWRPYNVTPDLGFSVDGAYWTPKNPYMEYPTGEAETYTYNIVTPVHTITYEIINGTWSETSSGPQVTTVVKEYAATQQMGWRPYNTTPTPGWSLVGAYWDPENPYMQYPTEDATYTYNIVNRKCIVRYEIVNGTWEDGTTTPITEEFDPGQQIPRNRIPQNMVPYPEYPTGAWSPRNPYLQVVTEDITYTYSFFGTPNTVTYKIVNGTWADGTTTQKTETVYSGLTPANIPEGMIPLVGYRDGEWAPDPYNTVITEDTTFTYECIEVVAIRLIAKKEISSNYMDEDAIATISTSGMTYLNQGDIIYMYGKLVAADQNEVILVIHGPTA